MTVVVRCLISSSSDQTACVAQCPDRGRSIVMWRENRLYFYVFTAQLSILQQLNARLLRLAATVVARHLGCSSVELAWYHWPPGGSEALPSFSWSSGLRVDVEITAGPNNCEISSKRSRFSGVGRKK